MGEGERLCTGLEGDWPRGKGGGGCDVIHISWHTIVHVV